MLRTVSTATAARLGPCEARVQDRHVIGRSGQPLLHRVVDLPWAATPEPALQMTLPARAENISVIRRVLVALGETLRLDSKLLDDLRLAVTEACTNVVRHAYAGDRP